MKPSTLVSQPSEVSIDNPRNNEWVFAIIVALVHFLLLAVQISHHVMWRDELRPWQLIKPCRTFGEMISVMRYDGVPPLWNTIVFLLTRITTHPESMAWVNALFAAAAVLVVARWAPFSRSIKVLFALGYYPLFEYGVIARSYALLFLLVLIACAMLSQPRLRLIWLVVPLFLLIQTSIWGAGFAILLWAFGSIKAMRVCGRRRWPDVAISAVALGVSLTITLLTIFPGPGKFFAASSTDAPIAGRLLGVFATAFKAFVPVPAPTRHFWNTNILDPVILPQALLGILLLGLALSSMQFRRDAQWLFIIGSAGLLAFAYRFPGEMRHHGHLFILLIATCWIAQARGGWFLHSILSIHALAGIAVAIAALGMPFSDSRQVSEFIRSNFGDDQVTLVGIPDYCTSPISEWLGQPIYFPEMRRFATVNTQNDAERPGINPDALLKQIDMLIRTENKPVILIAEAGFSLVENDTVLIVNQTGTQRSALRCKVLPSFEQGVVESESAKLYLITIDR